MALEEAAGRKRRNSVDAVEPVKKVKPVEKIWYHSGPVLLSPSDQTFE